MQDSLVLSGVDRPMTFNVSDGLRIQEVSVKSTDFTRAYDTLILKLCVQYQFHGEWETAFASYPQYLVVRQMRNEHPWALWISTQGVHRPFYHWPRTPDIDEIIKVIAAHVKAGDQRMMAPMGITRREQAEPEPQLPICPVARPE